MIGAKDILEKFIITEVDYNFNKNKLEPEERSAYVRNYRFTRDYQTILL